MSFSSMSTTTERLRQDALLRARRLQNGGPSSLVVDGDGAQFLDNSSSRQQVTEYPNSIYSSRSSSSIANGSLQQQHHSFPDIAQTTSFQSNSTATLTTLPNTNNSNHVLRESSAYGSHMMSSSSYPSIPQHLHPAQSLTYMSNDDRTDHHGNPQPLLPLPQNQIHPRSTYNNYDKEEEEDVDMAVSARHEWKQYGRAKTQVLEELRHHGSGGRRRVQVVAAEPRVDVTGAAYTVYRIHVTTLTTPTTTFVQPQSSPPPPQQSHQQQRPQPTTTTMVVERRYSDFYKLHVTLASSSAMAAAVEVPFPAKHWAGRLGNWTPAQTWAPATHAALLERRVQMLDAWLVHVVAAVSSTAHATAALDEFLSTTAVATSSSSSSRTSITPPPSQHRNNDTGRNDFVHWINPVTFTLGSAIRQAAATVTAMCRSNSNPSNSIPIDLLQAATGLVFLTVIKAGLVVSGRVGTGLLLAKLPAWPPATAVTTAGGETFRTPALACGGWSAPVAVGTVGVGWGAQMGGDVTHYLIVLTTPQAVRDFGRRRTVNLGAELGVSVGPTGRSASQQVHTTASDWALHSAYAYALSAGFFVGLSLEGSVVSIRHEVNTKFYGRPVKASDLLQSTGVPAAEPLYAALNDAVHQTLSDTAFRPSRLWQNQQ